MTAQQSGPGVSAALWKQLTSVKLSVAVLLTIAATAVIGTLIPQNRPQAYYLEHFGESLYPILSKLNILDMYHSLWFQALLLLLAVNITACSLDRIKGVLKIVFSKDPGFSPTGFSKTNATEPTTIEAPVSALLSPCRQLLGRKFSRTAEQQTENDTFLFGESGRFSRLGVYIVHLSILVLLAGALIGSLFGFEGHVNLPEGETTDHIFLSGSNKTHDLGFTVRCDDFNVAFYDNGLPKEYRSSLAVLDGGELILEKDILVNKPLRFKGVGIFQSSYGAASAKDISVRFISAESQEEYFRTIKIGEPVTIPENLGTFTATRLINDYLFHGEHNIGETIIGMLERDGNREMVALPLKFPKFDKMRQGDVIIMVTGFDKVFYTGLQVKKDPGVPLVYTGFLLIIAGIYITFFLSHMKCCIKLTDEENKTVVTVYCKANKNKLAARKKAQKLHDKLVRLSEKAVFV